MPNYLIFGTDYKTWEPDSSFALSVLEEILRRNLSCSYSGDSPDAGLIKARAVIFAEKESACFLGLEPAAELEWKKASLALDLREAGRERRFYCGKWESITRLVEKAASSSDLIDECEKIRLKSAHEPS
jgi:hypothetical protein